MATPYQDITDQVLNTQAALLVKTETAVTSALTAMDNLAVAAETALTTLESTVFSPSFTDDLNYVGPDGTVPSYATEPDYVGDGPVAPELNTPDPVAAFDFTDVPYEGLLKTEMVRELVDILDGNLLLPDAVVDAMFDRMTADFAREQTKNEWLALDNGASNGWTLPSERSLAGTALANEMTHGNTQAQRLEAYVQEWVNKQKDMYKALDTSVPFETQWMTDHHKKQDRGLDVAIAMVQQAIAVFANLVSQDDLKIRLYGAQWDTLSKRTIAAAQMFQARIANTRVGIASEGARFSFENTQVSKALNTEQGKNKLDIARATLNTQNTLGTLTSIMQVASNIGMAYMSASDVALGTGTSFGASETHSYAEKCCE